MAKFWFKVALLGCCLAAVIAAKIYLSDMVRHSAPISEQSTVGGLEVEAPAKF